MKKIRNIRKKLICTSLALLMGTAVINPNVITYAFDSSQGVETTFNEKLSEDKLSSDVEFTIEEKEAQEVQSVQLPDGTKVSKSEFKRNDKDQLEFTFHTEENETLNFVVEYIESTTEESHTSEVKTKEFIYEVSDIKTLDALKLDIKAEDITFTLGENVDFYKGIVVKDEDGKDITSDVDIKVTNYGGYNEVAGKYEIIYQTQHPTTQKDYEFKRTLTLVEKETKANTKTVKETREESLINITSNKDGGWLWWDDSTTDPASGTTHVQYNVKVLPDGTTNKDRTIIITLGNEDDKLFRFTSFGTDTAVVKSSAYSADKRTLTLVLNNSAIASDGWTTSIIVEPISGNPLTSYITGKEKTYGTYIGQRLLDNQKFGMSATITEGDKTAKKSIDFSFQKLYDLTGGADSTVWINQTGQYTGKPDSPLSLADCYFDLESGAMGAPRTNTSLPNYQYVQFVETSQMHMPAGDFSALFYKPAIYGGILGKEAGAVNETGIFGSGTAIDYYLNITGYQGGPYYLLDSSRPVAPGEYEAEKESIVTWYQLEYNPTTKELTKVKHSYNYGKIKVTVPDYTPTDQVKIFEEIRSVDALTTSVSLHYDTYGGSLGYDYPNGTITFDIPEHFNLTGIELGLFTQFDITYDDGTKKTVNVADMSDGVFSIPDGKKITKVIGKMSDQGIPGPYRLSRDYNRYIRLDGSYTDPDPTTTSEENREKNMIIINVTFDSEDGKINHAGKIPALFVEESDSIKSAKFDVSNPDRGTDLYLKTPCENVFPWRDMAIGIGTLAAKGEDGTSTRSKHYKNLELTLSASTDSANELGEDIWNTLSRYSITSTPGTYYDSFGDNYIEYTITGETQPRKQYIYKDGKPVNTGDSIKLVGVDLANGIYITSFKLHFDDISIKPGLNLNTFNTVITFKFNGNADWLLSNPKYDGKDKLNGLWINTITHDELDEPLTATGKVIYNVGTIIPITSNQGYGWANVNTPTSATIDSFINSDIKIVSSLAMTNFNGEYLYNTFPKGTNMYLQLGENFTYYGPTKETDENSKIILKTDVNGATWIVYDLAGQSSVGGGFGVNHGITIPAGTIRVKANAVAGQSCYLFEKVYTDAEPLKNYPDEESIYIGKYGYNAAVTNGVVEDIWGITENHSKGLFENPIVNTTQLAASNQDTINIIPSIQNNLNYDGVNWTAENSKNLKTTLLIGSNTKEFHNYDLLIPLPQEGGKTSTKETTAKPSESKDNDYTLHVSGVTLPTGLTGKVIYYDTEDGTGTEYSTPTKNTKSIRIVLDKFSGGQQIELSLYADDDDVYTIDDSTNSYICATAKYSSRQRDEQSGTIIGPEVDNEIGSQDLAKYTFNWYTMSGKIFTENVNKVPDGLYNTGDTLYNSDKFTFKDLTDGKTYIATVDKTTGIYTLRIQPKTTAYKLAPDMTDLEGYVLTKDTNDVTNEAINTNFPRNYKTEGVSIEADLTAFTAADHIKDFMNVNVGLYKQPEVKVSLEALRVKVGDTKTYTITPAVGGYFESVSTADGTKYGTFSSEIKSGTNMASGTITFKGNQETLDTDGKTLIDKTYTVTLHNYFGDQYTVVSNKYQVYKDSFVTFMKDVTINGVTYAGVWGDAATDASKEVLTTASGDKQTINASNVPSISTKGCHFLGWTLQRDGSVVQENITDFTNIEVQKYDVLYPNWKINTYAIAFDGNGADGSGTMSNQEMTYGVAQPLKQNTLTRTGYTFVGWSLSKLGSIDYTDEQTINSLTDEQGKVITLYAVWQANTYTIAFDGNGDDGSGTMSNQAMTYDKDEALTQSTFTRMGYTFAGWSTTATGNVAYGDAQVIKNLTGEQGKQVTLYAVWKANAYTIVFDGNGADGSGTMSNQVLSYDEAKALTQNAFTKKGYTFVGWSTTATGSIEYTDTQTVKNLADEQSKVITLYALWKANSYTIAFDKNGADGNETMNDQAMIYDEAKALTQNTFTRTGYTFIGWSTTATGSVEYTDGESVKNLVDEDGQEITLYAVWQAHSYKINYDKNAADATESMVASEHVYDTEKGLSPNKYRKTGYTFVGWSTAATGSVEYTDGQIVKNLTDEDGKEITLYAVWQANTYTIVFDRNGADGKEVMSDQVFTYDEAKALIENTLTRTGYTFKGWSTEKDGNGTFVLDGQEIMNFTAQPNAVIHLYAQWEIEWYNVDFEYVGNNNPTNVTKPSSATVEYGKSIVKPTVNNPENWTLDGWYKDKECTQEYDFNSNVTSNITLYAKWSYQEPSAPIQPEEPEKPTPPVQPNIPTQPTETVKPSTPTVPDEVTQPEEKEIVVAISRDIPLSKLKNGITEELLRQYITVTSKDKAVGYKIVSHNVSDKAGNYEVIIQLDNGDELTVSVKVVDDAPTNVSKPAYGQDENCVIHWIILLLLLGYSVYAISVILKRRHDIKNIEEELDNRIEPMGSTKKGDE